MKSAVRMVGVFGANRKLSYGERQFLRVCENPFIRKIPRPASFLEAVLLAVEEDIDLLLLSQEDLAFKGVFGPLVLEEGRSFPIIVVDDFQRNIIGYREAIGFDRNFCWDTLVSIVHVRKNHES